MSKVSALKLGRAAHVQLHEEKEVATVTKALRVWESGGLSSGSCFRTLEGCGWHQSHMAEQRPFLQNAASQHSPDQAPSAQSLTSALSLV